MKKAPLDGGAVTKSELVELVELVAEPQRDLSDPSVPGVPRPLEMKKPAPAAVIAESEAKYGQVSTLLLSQRNVT